MIFLLVLPFLLALSDAKRTSFDVIRPDSLSNLLDSGEVVFVDGSSESSESSESNEECYPDSHQKHHPRHKPHKHEASSETPKCPTGWTLFRRSGNRQVCLKYINNGYNPDVVCSAINAQIAGLELQTERDFVYETANADFKSRGITKGSVWIGAHRNESCMSCPVEQQFLWTDGFTVGLEPFAKQYWESVQPDNNHWYSSDGEKCMDMVIIRPDSDLGKYNDEPCELKTASPTGASNGVYGVYGTICGYLL